jgi:PAS domain S-box-containing protein
MYAADGRVLWIRDIVTLAHSDHETIMRGLMVDISEAKQAEQALRLSEQKFASVFQQCPDILVIARRADGCLLEANNAFEQQTGIPVSEALGKTATELNIWGIPEIGQTLLKHLQDESLRNLEIPFQRRDGQPFTGLISAQAFQLADTPALVVVVRDISQLKATQQQLLISEEKFARAFHASPDGLVNSRVRDGQLIEINEGFSRITGHSSSQAAGRSTLELGVWANPADRARMIEQIGLHGSVRDISASIRARNGQTRLCELSVQPIQVGDEPCPSWWVRRICGRARRPCC